MKKKPAKKPRPIRFELVWSKARQAWNLTRDGAVELEFARDFTRDEAERGSRYHARGVAGKTTAVTFRRKTRAGRIGKGGRAEASYNCDSRRRKG